MDICLATKNSKELIEKLNKEITDLSGVNYYQSVQISTLKLRLKIFFGKLKFDIRKKREEIKQGGPLFGGGQTNYELLRQYIEPIAFWVFQGIAWDIFKKVVLVIYSDLKTSKREFIKVSDETYEPCAYHRISFLIPNDLSSEQLNRVLIEAESLYNGIKPVRYSFGAKEIILKFDKYWNFKIIKYY